MDLSFGLMESIIIWIVYSIGLPWLVFKICLWCIERCGEERLQIMPLSPWLFYFKALFQQSHQVLLQLSKLLPAQTIYQGLNPERCTQQTMKTLYLRKHFE